jgi:Cephalosporin hydroxylase
MPWPGGSPSAGPRTPPGDKGTGAVISIDIEVRPGRLHHDRLTYITGSSTDQAVIERLTRRASDADTVLVVLEDFLKENDAFRGRRHREKLLLTFNPRGWLRKLR